MDKIKSKIEDRIKTLNYNLPKAMVQGVFELGQLKSEIKRYRSRNIQNRFRNFLMVALILAVIALVVDNDSYQYYLIAGVAIVAAIILLSPSARYTRNLSLARQKLFLMELLLDMNVPIPAKKMDDIAFEEEE